MDLSFQAVLADAYKSSLQRIRVLSLEHLGSKQRLLPKLRECEYRHVCEQQSGLGTFFAAVCNEDYELKSQRKQFGAEVDDGAYPAMIRRLSGNTNPNLLLLNYNFATLAVTNLVVIPKHFFTTDIIEGESVSLRGQGAPVGRLPNSAARHPARWTHPADPERNH